MNTITRRELLVVYPSPSQFSMEDLVDLSLWRPRIVDSVESGAEAAGQDGIAVGLIVLDSPAIRPLHLEPLVLKDNTTWIAATSREWLRNPECLQFVLQHCYDYHTLPVDPQRLMFALGHAHGVACLRRRLGNHKRPVERYGMVGNNHPGPYSRVNGKQLGATLKDARATMDEKIIRMALQKNASNISMAARELGVSRVTLYRLMDKFNLRGN